METTCDGILNKRVLLEQPKKGFRVAIDTVLMASAAPIAAGQSVLDMGCGVGGALLALLAREPNLKVAGIDLLPELAELAVRNITRNNFEDKAKICCGTVFNLPLFFPTHFDVILMNPPFHEADHHDPSPWKTKKVANMDEGDLHAWIKSAMDALKPEGVLTLIHRADREEDIVTHLKSQEAGVHIKYLLPHKGQPPKRILVRASRSFSGITERPSLVLHKKEGGYTDEVERLLREPVAMDF